MSEVSCFCFRSRLAIIPQDAFLFSGAVRDNLDPWKRVSAVCIHYYCYKGDKFIFAFNVRKLHTIRIASFWLLCDVGAILDWLATRFDFMRSFNPTVQVWSRRLTRFGPGRHGKIWLRTATIRSNKISYYKSELFEGFIVHWIFQAETKIYIPKLDQTYLSNS